MAATVTCASHGPRVNGDCRVILASTVTECGELRNCSIFFLAKASRRKRGVRRCTGRTNISPGRCISGISNRVHTVYSMLGAACSGFVEAASPCRRGVITGVFGGLCRRNSVCGDRCRKVCYAPYRDF